jgi:hypothetical protein
LPKLFTQNSISRLGFQTGRTTGILPRGIAKGARLTTHENGGMRAKKIGREPQAALGTSNTGRNLGVTSVKGVGTSHGNAPRGKNAREHRTPLEGKIRVNLQTVHARPGTNPVTPDEREQRHKEAGKRVRGESDDSSLHLNAPEKAVTRLTVLVPLEQGSPTVSLEIEGKRKRLIIDTGSNVSILQPGVSRRDVRATAVRPYGVTGEALVIRGQQLVSFVLGGRKFRHTFWCALSLPSLMDYSVQTF